MKTLYTSSDHIELGVAPWDEDVVSAPYGTENRRLEALEQCQDFVKLLKIVFGEPPPNARFKIMQNPYEDFFYYDVVVEYRTDSESAQTFAYIVEANTPALWSETVFFDWSKVPNETDVWVKLHRTVMLPDKENLYSVEVIIGNQARLKEHCEEPSNILWVHIDEIDSEIPILGDSI